MIIEFSEEELKSLVAFMSYNNDIDEDDLPYQPEGISVLRDRFQKEISKSKDEISYSQGYELGVVDARIGVYKNTYPRYKLGHDGYNDGFSEHLKELIGKIATLLNEIPESIKNVFNTEFNRKGYSIFTKEQIEDIRLVAQRLYEESEYQLEEAPLLHSEESIAAWQQDKDLSEKVLNMLNALEVLNLEL